MIGVLSLISILGILSSRSPKTIIWMSFRLEKLFTGCFRQVLSRQFDPKVWNKGGLNHQSPELEDVLLPNHPLKSVAWLQNS